MDAFPSSELIQKSLKEQFCIQVPFGLSSMKIQEAVTAFLAFLNEPDTIKTRISFSIAPKHRRGDVGYVRRDAQNHVYDDSKEFFHYHPAITERHPDLVTGEDAFSDFLKKADVIWNAAYETVWRLLSELEDRFPGIRGKVFDTKDVHLMIRFLKYEWQNSGTYLAKPHFDAGSFTLAIAESAPGLRIGSNPKDLRPITHEKDKAIFMLSSNFRTMMDSGEFSAGWHDVIQTNESQIGQAYARWAVVAFVEAHGAEALPRSVTHRWVHENVV